MERISEIISDMIEKWLQGLVDIFISFIKNVVLNYDGLAGLALKAYDMFVWFSGILLVTVCLGKIITMLLSEADGSQEANAWQIIVDTLRSGIFLVLAPLIVSVSFKITKAFTDYFFSDIGVTLKESVTKLVEIDVNKTIGASASASAMWTILTWLFVLIVLAFFVWKMAIEQAQLMFDEILSPLVAVSISTDEMNMAETWAKDILSHAVTIVTLVLSIGLFSEALVNSTNLPFWGQVTAIIGTGAIVISGPSMVRNIWFSSGTGRSGRSVGNMAMRYVFKR